MHSSTACASCSLYNAQRSVTERYVTLQKRSDCYRTLRERYGAITERCGTVTENIDFAHQ